VTDEGQYLVVQGTAYRQAEQPGKQCPQPYIYEHVQHVRFLSCALRAPRDVCWVWLYRSLISRPAYFVCLHCSTVHVMCRAYSAQHS
jgi:hypothetical protein